MRGNDDRIAGLKTDEAFEDSRGCRICRRDNSGDQTDRLGNLLDAVYRILLDHTACLCVTVCIVNVLCCIVVLDDLVLDQAHAGLFDCHLCKRNPGLVSRRSSCFEDLVDLLL